MFQTLDDVTCVGAPLGTKNIHHQQVRPARHAPVDGRGGGVAAHGDARHVGAVRLTDGGRRGARPDLIICTVGAKRCRKEAGFVHHPRRSDEGMSGLHTGIDHGHRLRVQAIDVGAVGLVGDGGGLPDQRQALVEGGLPELVDLDPEDARVRLHAGEFSGRHVSRKSPQRVDCLDGAALGAAGARKKRQHDGRNARIHIADHLPARRAIGKCCTHCPLIHVRGDEGDDPDASGSEQLLLDLARILELGGDFRGHQARRAREDSSYHQRGGQETCEGYVVEGRSHDIFQ